MIALSHTLPCRGKSLIVVFLSSPMNLSKFLCNVRSCQSRQTLKLPLVHLIIFKVFAAPCLSHSLTGAVFLRVWHYKNSVLQETLHGVLASAAAPSLVLRPLKDPSSKAWDMCSWEKMANSVGEKIQHKLRWVTMYLCFVWLLQMEHLQTWTREECLIDSKTTAWVLVSSVKKCNPEYRKVRATWKIKMETDFWTRGTKN